VNYPIWDLPASGLLIAGVAILHVFISHFAVGGGLFLVVTERKARREGDAALLDYVRRHSRFFMLLTLVLGAVTGVGIWFTIMLVHPTATSSLISTFVWGWAIEWTFFLTEIAAAMVYYYGWGRLSAKLHETVGWIYFGTAWLSLFVINGILTYMMTPGLWVTTRRFWDGFFNETFWPSLVTRTFVCIGLAGIYALLTMCVTRDLDLKERMARYAGWFWIVPMAVAIPVGLLWYVSAAIASGVPAGRILGGQTDTAFAAAWAVLNRAGTGGYPSAQSGAMTSIIASVLVLIVTLAILSIRRRSFGFPSTVTLMVLGILAFGGGEWVREDLRKPYVIGKYMFVNGTRLPAPAQAPRPPAEVADQARDRFSLDVLDTNGVLDAALWVDAPPGFDSRTGPSAELDAEARADVEAAAGERVFRLLCTMCHTTDGYMAIRPLVHGQGVGSLKKVITSLARPVGADGNPTTWDDPALILETRLGRRMPPFTGTEAEKQALAVYLARLGGRPDAGIESAPRGAPGGAVFEDNCAICHGEGSDWPIQGIVSGLDAAELYELIGVLPDMNDMMPEFEGTEEERRALAEHLADLGSVEGVR